MKAWEIDASLDKKLQGVKWGEYRLGDLFEKVKVKKAVKKDVRNYNNKEFCVPVVYCKFGDNGIMYWGRKNEFTTCENTISIIYNGEIAAGKVYVQKEATGILAESYFVEWKNYKPNFSVNLFVINAMEKVLYHKYSRDNLATWDGKVENDYVQLPTKNDKIDFEFMEQFTGGIQKSFLNKANEFVKDKGYLNPLTAEEKNITNKKVKFEKFVIGKLFDIHPTKAYKKLNDEIFSILGNNPVVSNSAEDNGIGGYSGLDTTENGGIITLSDTTSGANTIFYQEHDFVGYPHVQGMYPYDKEHWNKECCLYFVVACRRASGTDFDYAVKFNRKLINKIKVYLPVQDKKDRTHKYHDEGYIPNWDYMETYIKALEKQLFSPVKSKFDN